MRNWKIRVVSGAVVAPLIIVGAGLVAGLGSGLANSGVASAAGPTVSGTYHCATPLGSKKVPTSIQDLNTAPASLPLGTIYAAQPQVVLTIPASLITLAYSATPGAGALQTTKATLNVTSVGFSGSGGGKIPASNLPVPVPVNATTAAHGAIVTFNYPATPFTMTATPGGTATITPAAITLVVVTIPLKCVPPSMTVTYPPTTTSNPTFQGSNTLSPIDSVTSSTAVKPIVRTWEAAADGGVFAFGNAKSHGSMGGQHLNAPIVGMAATPTGGGYWLVAADGGVFAFGNAQFYGSEGGKTLNKPMVGMAATPTGGGYWLVAADGGVFAFGNAQFYGSEGGKTLDKPVVGIAATPTGAGYWAVASDGGVFAFGTATFHGSEVGKQLNSPVVGIASTITGGGYWEVAADGGVFNFGTAPFHGSVAGQHLNAPIVGVAATPTGGGYWEVAADGGIFNFGTARLYGSMAGQHLNAPIVGMAAT